MNTPMMGLPLNPVHPCRNKLFHTKNNSCMKRKRPETMPGVFFKFCFCNMKRITNKTFQTKNQKPKSKSNQIKIKPKSNQNQNVNIFKFY